MKTTVAQILKAKGDNVFSLAPQASVYEALQLMAEKNVGALVVLDQGKLAGIFSERDYARSIILRGKASPQTAVREVMTEHVHCVAPDTTVEECMALMSEKHVRHLPVLENGQLVGIVSIRDVINKIMLECEFTIERLEKYITGTEYGT